MKSLNQWFPAAACAACIFLGALSRTSLADSGVDEAAALKIAQLIEQLDDDSFAVRSAAGDQLAEMGAAAFEALINAAEHGSREATSRAVDVLASHLNSDDAQARLGARRALHRIAAGENTFALRQAEQALAPAPQSQQEPPHAPAVPQPLGANWPAFRPPFAPALPMFPPAALANAQFRRVVVHNMNGIKEVNVEEDGKTIRIHDDPNNGVTVEITEKDGDEMRTRKYSAESARRLQEKSPEAHQIYQRYAQQAAADAAGLPGPAAPVGGDHVDRIQQHLDDMIQRYQQRMQQGGLHAEHYRRIIDHLQQHKSRLQAPRQELPDAPVDPAA